MISLIHQPIDPQQVLAAVASNDAGAIMLFLGTTREFTHGRRTVSLDMVGTSPSFSDVAGSRHSIVSGTRRAETSVVSMRRTLADPRSRAC